MTEPLNSRDFEVLVTLVDGPKHGYAIMRDLREVGGAGAARVLGPGTLYRVLKDLSARGLITVAMVKRDDAEGPPRRYHRLTAAGERVTTAEARRLEALVRRARPLFGPERAFVDGPA